MDYTTTIDTCEDCNCISTVFNDLTSEEFSFVDQHRAEVSFRKGEMVCKQGTFATSLLYIRNGLVKVFLEERNTNPTIVTIETRGYFLGLQSLFGKKIFHYSAEALEDTEVCQIDINVFRELLSKNGKFASRVIERINEDTIRSYGRLNCVTQKQVHGRFADLVLCLNKRIYKCNPFQPTLSRKDMAEITVMSHESLSRVVKNFKNDKILKIHKGKTWEILDQNRLEHIANIG